MGISFGTRERRRCVIPTWTTHDETAADLETERKKNGAQEAKENPGERFSADRGKEEPSTAA